MDAKAVLLSVVAGVLLVFGIGAGCWGVPQYSVYHQRLEGEAELARAEYVKRVAVETAKAKRDAAVLEAEAEVNRAKGVAQANQIIGDSLKGNEAYLRYLWIIGLEHNQNQTVVYVPTETNLPVLEAMRLKHGGP